jgi:hypothetical protein
MKTEIPEQELSALRKANKELYGKVEFYRAETQKLREYCETNKIGKPNQKLFDALYDHVSSVQQENHKLLNAITEVRGLIYQYDEESKGWILFPDDIDFGKILTTIDNAINVTYKSANHETNSI